MTSYRILDDDFVSSFSTFKSDGNQYFYFAITDFDFVTLRHNYMTSRSEHTREQEWTQLSFDESTGLTLICGHYTDEADEKAFIYYITMVNGLLNYFHFDEMHKIEFDLQSTFFRCSNLQV